MTLRRQLENSLNRTAEATRTEWDRNLQRTTPVDTGEMRNRTTVTVSPRFGGWVIEAIADTPYARFVAGGTRPHVIRPRSKRALRFNVGSQVVFARSVNHPGTQPNPWWSQAFENARRTLRSSWGRR